MMRERWRNWRIKRDVKNLKTAFRLRQTWINHYSVDDIDERIRAEQIATMNIIVERIMRRLEWKYNIRHNEWVELPNGYKFKIVNGYAVEEE